MLHQKLFAKKRRIFSLSLLVVFICAMVLFSPLFLPKATAMIPKAAVIHQYGFEDGTTRTWIGRGNAVVTATTEAAHTGSYSLKVTGRTSGWNGPGLNVLSIMGGGATYEISGCVRLVAGQPASQVNFGVAQTVGGVTSYPWVGSRVSITDTAWVCLSGSYSYTGTATSLLLYAESDNPTAQFYLDDVVIDMVTPPTSGQIVKYDFEDSSTQIWTPRGTATLGVATDTTYNTSAYSLKVTGRTDKGHGPSVNVSEMLQPNNAYEIDGCVRLITNTTIGSIVYLPVIKRGEVAATSTGAVNASSLGASAQTSIAIMMAYTPTSGGPTVITKVAEGSVTDAAWTCLQGTYSFTSAASGLTLYVEAPQSPTAEFYLDDVVIAYEPPGIQTDIPQLYQTFADKFLIGAAIEPYQLDDRRHAELLTRHFNSLTPENVMKPGLIHPSENVYDWTGPDKLAQFARDHNMKIHGHTLLWHQQAAEWMFKDTNGITMTATPENKALLLQRLTDHIIAVTGRYSDVVNVWDVVNEVIDPAQPDCMRRSTWYNITGEDYIKTAFNVAHQMIPNATLLLNDYETAEIIKRECIYGVVQRLKNEGVPIEGIGIQEHINVENPTADAIAAEIDRFALITPTIEVHVTELDMSIYTGQNPYTTPDSVPPDLLIKQGHQYKKIFDVFKSKADKIASVTFWGMADDHTWLTNRGGTNRVDLPLLFDHQLQAKYAYWGVIDDPAHQLPPLRQQLNSPQGTPTAIDGNTELLWNITPWTRAGATAVLTADFQTRWDGGHLYVFADVKDTTHDSTDRVDIFIDEGNNKAGPYGNDDYHYMFQNGVISPSTSMSVTTSTTGYRLEAVFPFSGTVAVGNNVGFDIRVTDGNSNTWISWNDLAHNQESGTDRLGTLALIAAYKVTTATQGTPTIDGVEDAVWSSAPQVSTGVWVTGSSGSTATVKTLWDNQHLYVYAVVYDTLLSDASSNAWEEDSVEVFVDQNNGKTTSYQTDDGQFRINYNNVQSFRGTAASTATLTSATRIITGTGYAVELAITLNDVPPQADGLIGFDVQVNNDQDGNGSRDSVVMWSDPTGQSYQNTSRLGVLQFKSP